MERHSLTQNYFKVHVQFLQEQELLVAAADEAAVRKLVEDNVLPTTQQFQINKVEPLSEEEKQFLIAQMMGAPEASNEDVDPSGEVQDTRTLN